MSKARKLSKRRKSAVVDVGDVRRSALRNDAKPARNVAGGSGTIHLFPLGLAAEIRYTHAGDKQKYRHTFKRPGPTYFATIGGKSFVMIRVPAIVTRNKHPYIGD